MSDTEDVANCAKRDEVSSPDPGPANLELVSKVNKITLSRRMQKMKRMLPVLSLLCFLAGIYSITLFPTDVFSNNSYVSENALQPGVADPFYSSKHHREAVDLTKEYIDHLDAYNPHSGVSNSQWTATWLANQLERIHMDSVYLQPFPVFHHDGTVHEGVNAVGILKSPRTTGRESIVINVPSQHEQFSNKTMKKPVSSVCLAITMMKHLRTTNWLSKDVILVISDANYGDESIRVWLDAYHNYLQYIPSLYHFYESPAAVYFHQPPQHHYKQNYQVDFVRSGPIRGALVLDFFAEEFQFIVVCPEGINGKLPNLDLLNAIDRVAMYSENIHTMLLDHKDPLTNFLFTGEDPAFPDFSFIVQQLVAFTLHGAIGHPTGNHGWFLQYNIDAVTLRLHSERIPGAESNPTSLLKFARVLEGTIRCLSNLIEHFHQSFYYYILSTTFRYISIGQYMITFGMIVGSVTIFLGAICIGEEVETFAVRAVPRQLIFQASGVILYVTYLRLAAFPGSLVALCLVISSIAIRVVKRTDAKMIRYLYEGKVPVFSNQENEVKAKVVTGIAWMPVIMFLASFSLLNFPFCLSAAIVVGFVTLALRPTHTSRRKDLISVIGLLAASLPVLHYIAGFYFPYDPALYAIFLYLRFSSLIFPFFTLIYFPYILSLFSLAAWDI